jgi:hypothetical protein
MALQAMPRSRFLLPFHRWLQVHEIELQQAGQAESLGALQPQFAAVTCPTRRAVAVLNAGLPAEETERDERKKPSGRRPAASVRKMPELEPDESKSSTRAQ